MKQLTILLIALLTFSLSYSQTNISPFGGAGRSGAVSFTINDTVYVGLGVDGDTHYKDFWKYSKHTDQWIQIADFPGDARAYSQGFSINGKGYVGIGKYYVWATADTTFEDFYSYNPTTDEWTKLNNFGGGPRTDAVCFVIDNVAYIGTGLDKDGDAQKDFWKYNYLTDSWLQLTSVFSGDVRQSASAFTLNGKAYVTGGNYFTSYSFQLSDVQEYNPVADTWTEKIFADGINLSFNDATAFGYGGKGYICYGNKDKIVSYDPLTNEVENLGNLLSLEDMRMNAAGFILDDTAYFGLGLYSHDDGSVFGVSTYDNTIYKLDLPKPVAPSDITISNNIIDEGQPENTEVGFFTTEDENDEATHTYELVNSAEYPDNLSFSISNSSLLANTMDFSLQDTFNILVKTTNNSNGLSFEKEFSIVVIEVILLGINPFKGEAREHAVQFTIGDTVYVGLGRTTNNIALDDFWKYSHSTDKWERITKFPGGIRTSAVSFTIDGIGYVGLGYANDYNTMEKDFYSYNPATNAWTQIENFGGIARCGATAFVVDEIAYVGSGEVSNDQLKDFWAYNPGENTWTETTEFSGNKRTGASSFSINGKAYVVGGYYTVSAEITPIGDLHEFDPSSGSWTEITDYNSNLYDSYNATSFVFDNKAYICYGAGSKEVVVYNPISNEFSNFGNLLELDHERSNPISFSMNDSVYFGLGRDSYLTISCKSDILKISFPEAPTDITLSKNTILEGEPENTLVGTLLAEDNSKDALHTFELVDNENYPDNAAFSISGTSLISTTLDYEAQNSYTIRIKTTNNYNLFFDKEFVITVENVDGINSPKSFDEGFAIYPNPVESILNISCNSNAKINQLEIYNTAGELVLSSSFQSTLDLSGLTPASYVLLIITDKDTQSYPFIIE